MSAGWTGALRGQRYVVGEHAVEDHLASVASGLSTTGALVLYSRSAAADPGVVARVERALGDRMATSVTCAAPHSPIAFTTEVADRVRSGRPVDAIVTVGGGSVTDTAKGVAVLLAEGGDLESHCASYTPDGGLHRPALTRPKVPLIAVPTTFSAAELTAGAAGTTAQGMKRIFFDPQLAATAVLYDTGILAQVPDRILVPTGMNALAHCIEVLYSSTGNPTTDALARSGIEHLARGLPTDSGLDRLDRLNALATGAIMSGIVLGGANVCLHHAICHVLGGRLGLLHGDANSVVLEHAVRFNFESDHDGLSLIAGALGVGRPEDVPAAVAQLRDRSGAPRRLRDLGVAEADLPMVAEETMHDPGLHFNPRPVSGPEDVLGILRAAW